MGRFIGRLGVVSLPAVQAGLDLDERVVRRHAAKLEAAGWLARAPWLWGEGSIAWLRRPGVEGLGLGGLGAVKSPPGPTTIAHGVLVGWSAARVEHRGRRWLSARELALDPDQWAVPMRSDRGHTHQLPDLAAWMKPATPPIALIAESGSRREDRQKLILQGWRDAILARRYSGVRYDCTSTSVAHWITRLARTVALSDLPFSADVQPTAVEIAALPRADPEDQPEEDDGAPPTHRAPAVDAPNGATAAAAARPPMSTSQRA